MKGKRQRSYQERVMQIKNVLRTFYSERGMAPTQADISEAIEVSKPMVTYLLGRMSRDGIIENRGWQVVPRTREQKALKSRDYVAHGSSVSPSPDCTGTLTLRRNRPGRGQDTQNREGGLK